MYFGLKLNFYFHENSLKQEKEAFTNFILLFQKRNKIG